MRSSLSRFAFEALAARKNIPRSVPTTSALAQRAMSPEASTSRRTIQRNRNQARLSTLGLSEAAVSRLERCVCCKEFWTKKSVTQKLNHMETCAQQRAYTSETVSFLIEKELNIALDSGVENVVTQNTHLEDILQDALSKRKGRPRKKGSTLSRFDNKTRAHATKRLRAFVGPSVDLDSQDGHPSFPTSTQALFSSSARQSGDIVPGLPPSTPVIPPSKLVPAQRHPNHYNPTGSPSPTWAFHVSLFSCHEIHELMAYRAVVQKADLIQHHR
jgi:hypothetical protein